GSTTGKDKARKYQLVVANRLWGQNGFNFLPEVLKTTETQYGAGLKEVDFVKASEEARRAINGWVEQQTQDKIKNLIPKGVLTVDTRLVLTNAIYFKAAWMRPFSEKETTKGDFHLSADKKVTVPLMRRNLRTRYYGAGAFEALELPYSQNDL